MVQRATPRRPAGPDRLYNVVGAGHFETLQTPLLQGRDFNEGDRAESPRVCIINQALAERLWPGESAVGKRLQVGGPSARPREVVGVVKTGRYRSLGESPRPVMYLYLEQYYDASMTLLVRQGDPKEMVKRCRGECRRSTAAAVYAVRTFK